MKLERWPVPPSGLGPWRRQVDWRTRHSGIGRREGTVTTHSRSSLRKALVSLLALGLAELGATAPANAQDAQQKKERDEKLLIIYETKSTCTVYPNYPKDGVKDNDPWTIQSGERIVWRYNVNETWAAVQDRERAKVKSFPWWGFTRRDCIGTSVRQKQYPAGRPVPERILEGRSQAPSGWREVDFSVPPAPVVDQERVVKCNATLRDSHNFFIGNVRAGWPVEVTNETRGRKDSWVEVYVPNAKRWGYILRSKFNC